MHTWFAALAVLLAASACTPGDDLVDADPVPPEEQVDAEVPPTVEMVDISFQPDVLRIAAGMTVTWTNADDVDHTVTFADGVGSGIVDPGGTYSREFSAPGEFDYLCTIHEDMTGRIDVVVAEDEE